MEHSLLALISANSCIMQGGPYDSLKDLALRFLQNKVSTLPVIHSSSPDGSFPQLLHLATLSGILKCKLLFHVLNKLFALG